MHPGLGNLGDWLNSMSARSAVIKALNDSAVDNVNFKLPDVEVSITPFLLRTVRNHVNNGWISVVYRSDANGFSAYNSQSDQFKVHVKEAVTIEDKAIIVHEAVHAGLDAFRAAQVDTAASESAAYIAQCIIARTYYLPSSDRLGDGKDSALDTIFQQAWPIAVDVMDNRTVSASGYASPRAVSGSQYASLRTAIYGHKKYAKKRSQIKDYNGIEAPRWA